MAETPVVTAFLRHRGDVLLVRRSEEVDSYAGQWGAISGHVEGDSAAAHARREIREETGITDAEIGLVRAGEPFAVTDEERGTTWRVHPFLFDSQTREVTTNWELAVAEWVSPTAILDRDTVPDLWESYDCVRPTVETVAGDTERGSTALSVRDLEVLRDEAGLVAHEGSDVAQVGDLARELREARPAMAVVGTRIDRVMATADRTPAAIAAAAHAAIDRALTADSDAASAAADRLGSRVATLSRSGTVRQAIETAAPDHIVVAESRPGREGVGVAEGFAATTAGGMTVMLTTDTGFAQTLADHDIETLLVGADAVLPDGCVLNKVGTRGAATVAAHEGIDVLVVCASDKIRAAGVGEGTDGLDVEFDREERPASEVYDGEGAVDVSNPTFDLTPADCVEAVVTERGVLDGEAIADVAEEHRTWAEWTDFG